MIDEIFYCSNIEQLKAELVANGMVDEEGNYTHGNTMTPIKYNGVKSLSLVRNNVLDLALFPSLTRLGTYEEIFADVDKDALYKSVYDYTEELSYMDEEGVVHTYFRPQRLGEFA
ncbi:MAG: hypothetical protein KJO69_04060 [Gammaproteobacteria bacterium]|nr:hypothetical protein [Gammaproteobacteria bacterium]